MTNTNHIFTESLSSNDIGQDKDIQKTIQRQRKIQIQNSSQNQCMLDFWKAGGLRI